MLFNYALYEGIIVLRIVTKTTKTRPADSNFDDVVVNTICRTSCAHRNISYLPKTPLSSLAPPCMLGNKLLNET